MASTVVLDYVRIKPRQYLQPQNNIIDQESLATVLPVEFRLYKMQHIIQSHERILMHPPGTRPDQYSVYKEVAFFPVKDHSLLDQIQDFKEILSTVMGIPENNQSDILQRIEAVARTMDSYDGVYMEVNMLELNHQEIILPRVDQEDDMARAERESLEINEARPIPATKSSIDALERVVFDGLRPVRACTVCMEEMEAGSEAIRMPCSHVYHSDCIVQWLQTSHLCPLCRYHMPCQF